MRGVDARADPVVARLLALRQHQRDGHRSPHKALLALLALGQLAATGSSKLRWSVVEEQLGRLILDYGPASKTPLAQAAAYPFTRLRSDGVWLLSEDVPMDLLGPLNVRDVTGRLDPEIEERLRDPELLHAVARVLVEAEFPPTIARDVLAEVGLDPDRISATVPRSYAIAASGRHLARPGADGLGSAVRVLRVRRAARLRQCRHRSCARALVHP